MFFPILVYLVIALPPGCEPHDPPVLTSWRDYVVQDRDTLERMARRFELSEDDLARMNEMVAKTPLTPGEHVRVIIERLAPSALSEGLVINVPERALYRVVDGIIADIIPVAVGRGPTHHPHEYWVTKPGSYVITIKELNPTWHVPQSIQGEMRRLGKPVETVVAPGPQNPLGHLALHTSGPFVIHETPDRDSVSHFASHGCVRLLGEDARRLFDAVEPGTAVTVIYEDIKVARTPDDHVLVEAYPDRYGILAEPLTRALQMIADVHGEELIDGELLAAAVRARSGRIVDVSKICAEASATLPQATR